MIWGEKKSFFKMGEIKLKAKDLRKKSKEELLEMIKKIKLANVNNHPIN